MGDTKEDSVLCRDTKRTPDPLTFPKLLTDWMATSIIAVSHVIFLIRLDLYPNGQTSMQLLLQHSSMDICSHEGLFLLLKSLNAIFTSTTFISASVFFPFTFLPLIHFGFDCYLYVL